MILILLLCTPQQRLPMLFSGYNNPQKIALSCGGSRPHLIYGSLGRHYSAPNGISIDSVVFAQYTGVINTQTHRHTYRQTHRPRYVRHLSQLASSMLCMWWGLKLTFSHISNAYKNPISLTPNSGLKYKQTTCSSSSG